MLSASVSSTLSSLIVLMVVIGASSIVVNDGVTKSPLVFSKWPPPPSYQNNKSPQSLRQQIFVQLRQTGRIPSQNMMLKRYPPQSMSYMMRPMKYAQLKKTPIISAPSYYRPTISTPPRYRFQSSAQAPNTGEYVFENPFVNFGFGQNKKKISLTDESKYNPIHTVPAPNLNKNLAYSTHAEYIHDPMDNHIYEPKDPQFNQITFRPLTVMIPQYQVTEQINDHTVRVDPYTGKTKMFGSDSAHSIPTYKISQTFDSFSQPNAVGSRPLPFEISFVPAGQPQAQENSAPVASPLIQLANQEPQQQLPDTYAIPIGNQPQLQQHLLQQQSMLHNVPVVYNPTYLVTQSNNLLKQHREQLFKPAPAFLGAINQATGDFTPSNVQPLQDVNSAASPGQILNSVQSQQKSSNQAHQTQSQSQPPQSQSLLNSVPLRNEFQSIEPQSQNTPTFQRYVADRPGSNNNNIIVQQPILTESELNSLLSIGNSEHDAPNRFIASTYYQAQPDPQIELENRQRQHYNDIKIAKANEEIKEKVIVAPESTVKPNSRKKTAHQEHQEKLAEQFSGKTALRIIVPDEDDYAKKNEVRRSDLYRSEPKIDYEFKPSKPDYGRYGQYMHHEVQNHSRHDQYSNDDEQNRERSPQYVNDDDDDDDDEEQITTTETNDDYLAHDIESVDRLALDGETRDPINSSTIEYNY